MNTSVHMLSTGHVRITENWRVGTQKNRLLNALLDRRYTDWLPIYAFVLETADGLTVVDTGIPADANKPIFFPPYMPLVQRAASFKITPADEIGPQMRRMGYDPAEVRRVILTHLHQDHEGGLHHFANAEFLVARTEWNVATGFAGRMGGYLNHRWPDFFHPTLIDFTDGAYGSFEAHQRIADDIVLVATPGHSEGHLSVIIEQDDGVIFIAGDAAYTDELLLNGVVDGVGPDLDAQRDTHQRILAFAAQTPTVFLPSHDPDAAHRLQTRATLPQLALA